MLDFLTAANTYGFSHTGRHRTLGRFLIAFASWRQRRRQCAELYALNDRILKEHWHQPLGNRSNRELPRPR
jgi:Domain of unknown function (DUF1127)